MRARSRIPFFLLCCEACIPSTCRLEGTVFLCVRHNFSSLTRQSLYVLSCRRHLFNNSNARCSAVIDTFIKFLIIIKFVKVRHVQCQELHKQSAWASSLNLYFYLLIEYSTGLDYVCQHRVKPFLQHPWVAACQHPQGGCQSLLVLLGPPSTFPFPTPG